MPLSLHPCAQVQGLVLECESLYLSALTPECEASCPYTIVLRWTLCQSARSYTLVPLHQAPLCPHTQALDLVPFHLGARPCALMPLYLGAGSCILVPHTLPSHPCALMPLYSRLPNPTSHLVKLSPSDIFRLRIRSNLFNFNMNILFLGPQNMCRPQNLLIPQTRNGFVDC